VGVKEIVSNQNMNYGIKEFSEEKRTLRYSRVEFYQTCSMLGNRQTLKKGLSNLFLRKVMVSHNLFVDKL
jgi:hypothetical protein